MRSGSRFYALVHLATSINWESFFGLSLLRRALVFGAHGRAPDLGNFSVASRQLASLSQVATRSFND